MSPGPGIASPKPDVPAPTGLVDSGCLPDSVLPEGDEQACRPRALDVASRSSSMMLCSVVWMADTILKDCDREGERSTVSDVVVA